MVTSKAPSKSSTNHGATTHSKSSSIVEQLHSIKANIQSTQKKRILVWGDYGAATGFATVGKNIVQNLDATGEYEIEVVGINWTSEPLDPKEWPGKVWPAISTLSMDGGPPDFHGIKTFLRLLQTRPYDIVFIYQDTFVILPIVEQILEIQRKVSKPFTTVYYFPFDSSPPEEWVRASVSMADFPIAYTNYAKREVEKWSPEIAAKTDVIYHGTNTKDFFWIKSQEQRKELRRKFFGPLADRFIIANVNRNQPRKDPSRSLMVLRNIKDKGYNPLLYLHMSNEDFGGNLLEQAKNLKLILGQDFIIPQPGTFNPAMGFPINILNEIYNSVDLYLTTAWGEGWGLTVTESMCCHLPVVAPDNTSLPEILDGGNRGYLVPSGDTPSHWIVQGPNDLNRMRPLVNVEQTADTIIHIMNNYEEALVKANQAYQWATSNTWTSVMSQWNDVFRKAYNRTKVAENLANTNNVQPNFIKWSK